MATSGKLTSLLSTARQDGDPAARERAFDELLRLLTIFVRAGMGEALRRHRESMDICQSLAKSFVGDLRDGKLNFPTEHALIGYLQQIVRTKLAEVARHDRAIKRGGDQRHVPLDARADSEQSISPPAASDPTASVLAEGNEAAEHAMEQLKPDELELIRLRRAGVGWDQLAQRMGKSPAAVRQIWSRLQRRFDESIDDQPRDQRDR